MRKLWKRGIFLYLLFFLVLVIWWNSYDKRLSARFILTGEEGKDRENKLLLDPDKAKYDVLVAVARRSNSSTEDLIQSLSNADEPVVRPSWIWAKDIGQELPTFLSPDSTMCDGNFEAYGKVFARLKNVTVNPKFATGKRGGENISDVFNQREEEEYYKLKKGYFQLQCSNPVTLTYRYTEKSHLNGWLEAVNITKDLTFSSSVNEWTIAVLRYEYANLYHTMTDYYNAFLLSKVFRLDPDKVNILFVDGHPKGALDTTWQYLFKSFIRAGDLKEPTKFNNMLWNIMGYDSPLNQHSLPAVPYVDEFRQFFLSRHGISSSSQLNCDKLTVMFLWRKDYLAHPRNPSGSVSRKIKNEEQLIASIRSLLPNHNVFGVQIDKYSMRKQLLLISKVDILVGMHGAGLSHTLFLPKHAGLVELYPVYWSNANQHFKAMARWRGLQYESWSNTDNNRELPNKYTLVNEERLVDMVRNVKKAMCP